jgi:hypothetical protein
VSPWSRCTCCRMSLLSCPFSPASSSFFPGSRIVTVGVDSAFTFRAGAEPYEYFHMVSRRSAGRTCKGRERQSPGFMQVVKPRAAMNEGLDRRKQAAVSKRPAGVKRLLLSRWPVKRKKKEESKNRVRGLRVLGVPVVKQFRREKVRLKPPSVPSCLCRAQQQAHAAASSHRRWEPF